MPTRISSQLGRQVDRDLTVRIRRLRRTQLRLRELASGQLKLLPAEVVTHLDQLPARGFSDRWVRLETDLWILVFATQRDAAPELFRDQAEAMTDPGLRQLYLDYDRAHDLDPDDPRIAELAGRIVTASRSRYATEPPPGHDVDPGVPDLIQGAINSQSPAWRRLDALIRRHQPPQSPGA